MSYVFDAAVGGYTWVDDAPALSAQSPAYEGYFSSLMPSLINYGDNTWGDAKYIYKPQLNVGQVMNGSGQNASFDNIPGAQMGASSILRIPRSSLQDPSNPFSPAIHGDPRKTYDFLDPHTGKVNETAWNGQDDKDVSFGNFALNVGKAAALMAGGAAMAGEGAAAGGAAGAGGGAGAGAAAGAGGGLSAEAAAAAMEGFSAEAMAAYGGETAMTLSQASAIAEMGGMGAATEFLSSVAPELLPQFTQSMAQGFPPPNPELSPNGVPPPGNPNLAPNGSPLPEGVPPPANPFNAQSYLNPQNLANLAGSASAKDLLGIGSTLLGGLGGANAGGGSGAGGQASMDPRMESLTYGDLFPRTQGLLAAAAPHAQQLGADTISKGVGLLGTSVAGNGYNTLARTDPGNGYQTLSSRPVTGNGFSSGAVQLGPGNIPLPSTPVAANGVGAVQMQRPDTPTNPYLAGMAGDIQRRTQDLLGQNNLAIHGNAVATGGLGGSRQGVAQGTAAAKAAESLQGSLSGLYGQAYESDMNRSLSKYTADQGFYGQQRGQDLQLRQQGLDLYNQDQSRNLSKYQGDQGFFTAQRGQDLQKYFGDADLFNTQRAQDLTRTGLDMNFYGQQRAQDQASVGLGSSLITQGQGQQWAPLQAAADIYKPFSGLNSSAGGDSGTNWQGLLGGALQGASFAKTMGWF